MVLLLFHSQLPRKDDGSDARDLTFFQECDTLIVKGETEMRLTDPFAPTLEEVEKLVAKVESNGAKIELIDMLIKLLQHAKRNLRKADKGT